MWQSKIKLANQMGCRRPSYEPSELGNLKIWQDIGWQIRFRLRCTAVIFKDITYGKSVQVLIDWRTKFCLSCSHQGWNWTASLKSSNMRIKISDQGSKYKNVSDRSITSPAAGEARRSVFSQPVEGWLGRNILEPVNTWSWNILEYTWTYKTAWSLALSLNHQCRNFEKCSTFLCDILPPDQYLEKAFWPKIFPCYGTGPPHIYKGFTKGKTQKIRYGP